MNTNRLDQPSSILLVEDHPMVAQSLIRLLTQRGGYRLQTVDNADRALDQLQKHLPDLALFDVRLPGRSGIWLAEQAHARWPALHILMISGHASQPFVEQSLKAGARGYVLKEDVDGILEGVAAVLAGGNYISAVLRGEGSAYDPGTSFRPYV